MNGKEFYQMIEDCSADLHSSGLSEDEIYGSIPDLADNILSDPEVKKYLEGEYIFDEIEQKEFIEGLL